MSAPEPTAEHILKTWPPFFAAVVDGSKTFELRRDDRGFAVGDVLLLREWDPATGEYTGREVRREVTYIVRDAPHFGLMPGFVVLGIVASLTTTESTPILAPAGPAEVWVFGSFGNGHHLYTMGLLPATDRGCAEDLYAASRTLDSANAAREIQTEGAIVRCRSVALPPSWSFVSWWDRKGDPRHGSHTGILARGTWTDADLIAAGRRLVPWVFRVRVAE